MVAGSQRALAARLHALGEPLAVEHVELPEPAGDECLVALRYAGLNPVDRYMAQGMVAADGPLPRTLGSEAAGTLDGRPVLVAGGGLGATRDGVWATAAVVPAVAVIELPAGVELQAAAAMGVAGLTAYKCVVELARVGAEDHVLVLGAAGGVGSLIVSLARSRGAQVTGQTTTADKEAVIRRQGADSVIVCDAADLARSLGQLRPTVVFDPLGGAFTAPVIEALAPGGRLVNFGTSAGSQVSFNMQTLYRKGASILGYGGLALSAQERRRGLQATLAALAAGELRVLIGAIEPLRSVNEALDRLARREVTGKLVLDLRAGA
jgi:NADPH2:quinone reductase